ncbi:MAG: hypothetical protein A2Y33_12145 [Spirochaetes bacterium GWF1_51_8]|nr:MAG: hypothetical protein A2Y33_12145 [Spirochaetes bacterium GWF1_51_8]
MKRRLMTKKNWALVLAGIVITFIGYLLIRPITTNYDGLLAFIAIVVTILGLAIVIFGLSKGFETESQESDFK